MRNKITSLTKQQMMNNYPLSKYEIEAEFTKTEMRNKWNINFLQNWLIWHSIHLFQRENLVIIFTQHKRSLTGLNSEFSFS